MYSCNHNYTFSCSKWQLFRFYFYFVSTGNKQDSNIKARDHNSSVKWAIVSYWNGIARYWKWNWKELEMEFIFWSEKANGSTFERLYVRQQQNLKWHNLLKVWGTAQWEKILSFRSECLKIQVNWTLLCWVYYSYETNNQEVLVTNLPQQKMNEVSQSKKKQIVDLVHVMLQQ